MKKIIFIQAIVAFFIAIPALSQNDSIKDPFEIVDTIQDSFGLFASDEIMNISLRFDLTEYQRKKSKVDYLDAVLTYHINNKDSINKDVRLKSRGEFRNQNCNFPPIRLNFKKKEEDKDDATKIGKIKLVTHCNSGQEDYLFKEYLIYKFFNALTDQSFRVRLLKVNYINTRKQNKTISTYAFMIEPVEFLANRINAIPVDLLKLSQKNMLPEMMDRMAIFNYMIGNTDWSVPNQHNCKIFSSKKSESGGKGMIIPYDFDYTGMVNASYAIPPEGLGIKSTRERLFQGICRSEEEFTKSLKEFSDKKSEFYRIINEFTYINDKDKKEMSKYLDAFYDDFDERNTILRILMKDCKNL